MSVRSVTVHLDDALFERLQASVRRDNVATSPEQTLAEWCRDAILDCVVGEEDGAGLATCEGCGKVLPYGELSAAAEDGLRSCDSCAATLPGAGQ